MINNLGTTTNIQYRICTATDIEDCYQLESTSYPPDEAATLSSLQYRQKYATPYFLCAFLNTSTVNGPSTTSSTISNIPTSESNSRNTTLIGFICSTRCHTFTHDTMSTHVEDGSLLAIHSVVIAPQYRRQHMATHMLQYYIQNVVMNSNSGYVIHDQGITKIVLLAKSHLLSFYVNCGFQVLRPSSITHGKEKWYDLEMRIHQDFIPTRTTTIILDETKDTSTEDGVGYTYYVVDAFANPNRKGTGNPAAVVPLQYEPTNTEWMQTIAQEMNLSETAFVWKKNKYPGNDASCINNEVPNLYGIRYFTPTIEVDLCGHATLASSAIVRSMHGINDVVFQANHNVLLRSSSSGNGNENNNNNDRCTQISMTFPTQATTEITSSSATTDDFTVVLKMIKKAFPTISSTDDILFIGYIDGLSDLLIEVSYDAFIFETATSDLNIPALLEWNGYNRGVIICCVGPKHATIEGKVENDNSDDCDFISRFFAPKAGIDEDPVTGSAHCALAPYFGQKLQKTNMIGQQKSRRGGIVNCDLSDDGQRVTLSGTAVTIAKGTFWI